MRTKRALYNVVWNFILQITMILYGFLIPKIIISNFGSNVNGLITSITQFLGYIVLLESGFGPVLKATLYKPISKKDNKTIASILKSSEQFFRKIALVFIIYIFALSLIFPFLVQKEFEQFYTFSLVIIIGISTFVEYFFGITYKLYLQSEQKNYIISIIQALTYMFNILSIILMVKFKFSIHIIKLVSALLFCVRPIILQKYVKRKYNINLKSVEKKYKISNKWDGLSQHIASVIHSNTDVTLLTLFCGLIDVSIYSIYYMVISGIRKIVIILSSSVESGFGDMIAKKEIDNLNKKFSIYEFINNTIVTIIFSCTLILISPFVGLYTKSIVDADYVNPLFGYLFVISEYIYLLRIPYIDITYAAGHFKETRIGAWIECFVNIVISLFLVFKYGLIGVAIGTGIAMSIRMCEFIYHSNKYILKRNVYISIKKILFCLFETFVICLLFKYIPLLDNNNYINWIFNACIVFILSLVIVICINAIVFKKDFFELIEYIKILIKRKVHRNE